MVDSMDAVQSYDAIVARVTGHVRRLERRFPGIIDAAARWHSVGRRREAWPAWCYLPLGVAYELLRQDQPHRPELSVLVTELTIIASWHAGQ